MEKVLAEAFAIRGDALMTRLDSMQPASGKEAPQLNPTRLAEIYSAVERARRDLIDALPINTSIIEE
ncbi:MAG: hypothetical protein ACNA77_07915 [Opitutales bacterium]